MHIFAILIVSLCTDTMLDYTKLYPAKIGEGGVCCFFFQRNAWINYARAGLRHKK
jgi:hypothetical protein